MTIIQEEFNVINSVRRDMYRAIDRDGINKVYRQARVWNRYHHFLANACTYERYRYLNKKFKQTRLEALASICA